MEHADLSAIQDGERVVARFSDGTSDEFDVLVGADDQGSRILQAILPPGADSYRRLGIHMAYWFIPRIASDSAIRDTCDAPGGQGLHGAWLARR